MKDLIPYHKFVEKYHRNEFSRPAFWYRHRAFIVERKEIIIIHAYKRDVHLQTCTTVFLKKIKVTKNQVDARHCFSIYLHWIHLWKKDTDYLKYFL